MAAVAQNRFVVDHGNCLASAPRRWDVLESVCSFDLC